MAKWKWMPGMRWIARSGDMHLETGRIGEYETYPMSLGGPFSSAVPVDGVDLQPDTNDPATVGCLWQQLCEMAKARGWRQIMLTDDGKVLFHGHRDAPHAVRAFSDILGTIKLLSNVRHGLAAIEVAPEGDDV